MNRNSLDELSLRKEISILWKKKMLIGGVALIMTIINVIWNSPPITTPEFRVETTFIPPNLVRLRSLVYQRKDYAGVSLGSRWDAEKIIEYLNSYDVYLYMRKKYDFIKMYNIDTSDIEDSLLLEKTIWQEYQGHVEIKMSPFESVNIYVWNSNTELATRMANDLLHLANELVEKISHRKEALQNTRKSFEKFQAFQKELADSLSIIREKVGVYDFRHLSEKTAQTIMRKYYKNPKAYDKNYSSVLFTEKFSEHNAKIMSEILDEITFREEEIKSYPSYLTVINHAVPQKLKKRPKRIFLAIATFLTTAFLVSVILLIYSKFKPE